MYAYLLENQKRTTTKNKNAHHVTKHTYHTTGVMDLHHIRNVIPQYQTAIVTIDESVDLPTPGIYPVKIKVDHKWSAGIAILNSSVDSNPTYTRVIKVFIKDRIETPQKNDIAINWYFNIKNDR